jgi:hypothetical protein
MRHQRLVRGHRHLRRRSGQHPQCTGVPCARSGCSPSFCTRACTETPAASRSMTSVAAPRKTTRSTIAGTRFSPADPCASIRTRSGLITACAGPAAVAS